MSENTRKWSMRENAGKKGSLSLLRDRVDHRKQREPRAMRENNLTGMAG